MRELPWMLSVAACVVLGTAWLFSIAEQKRDLMICRSSVASIQSDVALRAEIAELERRLEAAR